MSLATWMEEFYPITADATTKRNAIEHSLRKWIGLRPENLAKHRVAKGKDFFWNNSVISDGEGGLYIESESCALCFHYYDRGEAPRCGRCPLAKAREGRPCDQYDSPYHKWLYTDDPEPMINDLEKALEAKKERARKRTKR